MRTVLLPPASPPFTKADWDLLPEGFPAQLVEGWLLKEPPRTFGHQILVTHILYVLGVELGVDIAVPGPFDVLVDDRNVYQPDVIVPRGRPPNDAPFVRAPLIAVEILAPETIRRDRDLKCPRLLAAGTGEVWLVDREAATIEIHDAAGCRRASGDTPIESRVLPGFRLVPEVPFAPPQ
jgi:Uma2 family endonuclease